MDGLVEPDDGLVEIAVLFLLLEKCVAFCCSVV